MTASNKTSGKNLKTILTEHNRIFTNKLIKSLRKAGDPDSDENIFIELSKITNLNTLQDSILKELKENYPALSLKYLSRHPKYADED